MPSALALATHISIRSNYATVSRSSSLGTSIASTKPYGTPMPPPRPWAILQSRFGAWKSTWVLDEQGAEKWVPGYLLSEQQYYEPDCVIANFYSAYSPTSPFIGLFRAVQATLDGKYYSLLNTEFKIRSAKGTDSVEPIETEQQRQDILKKYFDIVLTEEEWMYHDEKIDLENQIGFFN
ncbi:hypothetical protein BG000_001076 [Podila horticola]|nr:hypothetical protein BG000_001076 [Podila horticola]